MRHIQSVERKDFYFGVVESDQNNIPDDDILNLEEKNDFNVLIFFFKTTIGTTH